MSYKSETINCPLCGSAPEKHKLFFERNKKGFFIEQNGEMFNSRHVFCDDCGLIFINPRLTEESLSEFYRTQYRDIYTQDNHNELELINAKFREQFLKESEFLVGHKKLLDVGSSTGAFPFLMKRIGVSCDSVEPNEKHTALAQKLYGTTHFNTVIENFKTEKKYDMITIFDAFEHLSDPGKFLNKAHELLEENGFIYIELPTIYLPRIGFVAFFSAAHTFSYSEATLGQILEKHGFAIEHLDHSGQRRDLRVIAKKVKDKRTVFKKMDDFKSILSLWKMFENINHNVFPEILKRKDKNEIMELSDKASSQYKYFKAYIYNGAGLHMSNYSVEDSSNFFDKVSGLIYPEDSGVVQNAVMTVIASSLLRNKNFLSAYDTALIAEKLFPRMHEITDMPAQLDKGKILTRINNLGYYSHFYIIMRDLCEIVGKMHKKKDYEKIIEFYKLKG